MVLHTIVWLLWKLVWLVVPVVTITVLGAIRATLHKDSMLQDFSLLPAIRDAVQTPAEAAARKNKQRDVTEASPTAPSVSRSKHDPAGTKPDVVPANDDDAWPVRLQQGPKAAGSRVVSAQPGDRRGRGVGGTRAASGPGVAPTIVASTAPSTAPGSAPGTAIAHQAWPRERRVWQQAQVRWSALLWLIVCVALAVRYEWVDVRAVAAWLAGWLSEGAAAAAGLGADAGAREGAGVDASAGACEAAGLAVTGPAASHGTLTALIALLAVPVSLLLTLLHYVWALASGALHALLAAPAHAGLRLPSLPGLSALHWLVLLSATLLALLLLVLLLLTAAARVLAATRRDEVPRSALHAASLSPGSDAGATLAPALHALPVGSSVGRGPAAATAPTAAPAAAPSAANPTDLAGEAAAPASTGAVASAVSATCVGGVDNAPSTAPAAQVDVAPFAEKPDAAAQPDATAPVAAPAAPAAPAAHAAPAPAPPPRAEYPRLCDLHATPQDTLAAALHYARDVESLRHFRCLVHALAEAGTLTRSEEDVLLQLLRAQCRRAGCRLRDLLPALPALPDAAARQEAEAAGAGGGAAADTPAALPQDGRMQLALRRAALRMFTACEASTQTEEPAAASVATAAAAAAPAATSTPAACGPTANCANGASGMPAAAAAGDTDRTVVTRARSVQSRRSAATSATSGSGATALRVRGVRWPAGAAPRRQAVERSARWNTPEDDRLTEWSEAWSTALSEPPGISPVKTVESSSPFLNASRAGAGAHALLALAGR